MTGVVFYKERIVDLATRVYKFLLDPHDVLLCTKLIEFIIFKASGIPVETD